MRSSLVGVPQRLHEARDRVHGHEEAGIERRHAREALAGHRGGAVARGGGGVRAAIVQRLRGWGWGGVGLVGVLGVVGGVELGGGAEVVRVAGVRHEWQR